MKAEKEEKIDFHGPEKSKIFHKSRKVKCTVVAVVSLTLLAAAGTLLLALWPKHKVSRCLVEVNLEEGETLMYRVDQRFEVKEDPQSKETISSIVGFQVVNKTSDAYWFLLKINTTFQDKDGKEKGAITGYFSVRLPSTKDDFKDTGNETTEYFELHGYPQTDGEFVRYLHGLLYQLLPAVRRDLYEDIDGQTDKNLKPENSPLFPGPVRMHRQANTKLGGDVLVNNHFSQSDLVNSSSDMDLDVKYSDSAAINKSSGMISESNVSVTEQLHFGEPMKTKDGRDVTTMEVTLHSHVTRMEMDSAFFVEEEIKALEMDVFVRLVVPTDDLESTWNSLDGQRLSTQEPTTVIKRNRRAVGLVSNKTTTPHPVGGVKGGNGTVAPTQNITNHTSLPDRNLVLQSLRKSIVSIRKTFSLLDKKVIGVRTKAEGRAWIQHTAVVNGTKEWEMGADFQITLGSIKKTIYRVKYSNDELEKGIGKEIKHSWEKGIPFCFKVLIVKFCVKFSLRVRYSIKPPQLLTQESSLSPLRIALQFESTAEVATIVEAYASLWLVRAGVFADGTIIRATIPTKLSYSAIKPHDQQWCLASNAQLTALELHAGLFYQWRRCKFIFRWFKSYIRCWWGTRHTILSFGRWAAFSKNYRLYEDCFH